MILITYLLDIVSVICEFTDAGKQGVTCGSVLCTTIYSCDIVT